MREVTTAVPRRSVVWSWLSLLIVAILMLSPGRAAAPPPPSDPRTDLDISVQVIVEYDIVTHLYTYNYFVANGIHSGNSLKTFGLAPIEYVSSIGAPTHWTGFDRWERRIDAIVWTITENAGSLPPDSLDTGDIPINSYCTGPGQSVADFSIVSRQPPGTVTWYAQGEDSLISLDGEPFEEILDPNDGFFGLVSVQGTTTGPDINSTTGVEAEANETSPVARLYTPSPNPFGTRTAMTYELPKFARVELDVVNVQGRHVRTLQEGFRGPGRYVTGWNGNDDRGRRVSAGVYFVRLVIDGASKASQRFTLVR